MAGCTDSGSSRGRGRGGGGGFANRGVNSMNTMWREKRPAQQQHQQPQQQQQYQPQQQQRQQQHQQQHQQHRNRPVNDNGQSSQHLHNSPPEEPPRQRGQGTSTRRPQPTRPPQASHTHKSPAPAANANEPDEKASCNAANFECNVCFDMADDPVVTQCGHLFCWECLYQWLHVHSRHRECPVCKGKVAEDAIIPIYGRGGSAASIHAAPPRPTGARVESSRQQQQQQHQSVVDWHTVDDDEDDSPLVDVHRLGFEVTMLRDALLGLGLEDDDVYTNPYHHHQFDEVYTHDLLAFPSFAYDGAGSSREHGHHTAVSDDIMEAFFDNTHQELDFVSHGGRRQRGRARGATYRDRSSIFETVTGSSSNASYSDTGAGPHHINNTGASSRPNGGWTERRGRSNRNSNSGGGGGRGMQNNSRRQGAHYN